MSRPSTGKTPEHVKKANAARNAAMKRLINAHFDEWKELYREEAAARGIKARKSNTP